MSNLISTNQNAYVTNRFISEGGRLISDILEMTDIWNMKGYLLTIDIEKAFDSVEPYFLLDITNFLRWIESKFCIITGEITTHFFKLKKGTHQGDPISAYLFILVLEAVFCVIKSNKNIKGWDIYNHEFLYTAYANDTTFFLKDEISVFETLNIFHKFSLVSWLILTLQNVK